MSSSSGNSAVQLIRNAYASTGVTTAAYVELDSALNHEINEIEISDSSGSALKLALGAAGSEVDLMYIHPSMSRRVRVKMPKGARLSIRAVDTNATTGQLLITCFY